MRRTPSFVLSLVLSIVEALCLFALTQTFARAQTAAYAEITSIDTKGFPHVTALVDVFNANGEFISAPELSADGRPIAPGRKE